jgi:folate-binding protein YgfZ
VTGLDALHEALGVRWEADTGPAAAAVADNRAQSGTEPDTAAGPQVRIPRNYGDPAAEYAAVRDDVAVADRRDRRFVRVHGRDPVRMLQGLVTNDIADDAAAGRAVYAAVLTPKGRMVADVRVLRQGAELLLETDAAAAEPLMAHLRKYVPPLFARFEDATSSWGELGVYGPRARAVVESVFGLELAADVAEDEAHATSYEQQPVVVVTTSHTGVPGFDVICGAPALEPLWRELHAAGARPLGHATLDVLRIETGRPRWGAELTPATIPLEAGLRGRAISETKGCYTGQEVIVRILHRGHVNWLLRGVLLGDAAAPAAGTELVREDGRVAGRITSGAWSPRLAQAIALAYVRREVEPPAELRLAAADGPVATVVTLPFGGA